MEERLLIEFYKPQQDVNIIGQLTNIGGFLYFLFPDGKLQIAAVDEEIVFDLMDPDLQNDNKKTVINAVKIEREDSLYDKIYEIFVAAERRHLSG